jgi:hypothetical protein
MTFSIDRDNSALFTVVGSSYVAEQHADSRSHLLQIADDHAPDTGIAALWAVFYMVITAAWLFNGGAASRAFEYATTLLK